MRRTLIFADRAEAGQLLAARLAGLGLENPAVFALPRGGVPLGAEIAKRLHAPLDLAFVRKLGAPDQPELAVGAVAGDLESPEIVLNTKLVQGLGLDEAFICEAVARELAVIERQRRMYEGVRPAIDPAGRTAIVVDDGVATGMTIRAALRQVRRGRPARLIAAVPVCARDSVRMLRKEADEAVILSAPGRFVSVGSFYRTFAQVSDADVIALLAAGNSARTDD
jgi:predicted phosphoribosyltransferase